LTVRCRRWNDWLDSVVQIYDAYTWDAVTSVSRA